MVSKEPLSSKILMELNQWHWKTNMMQQNCTASKRNICHNQMLLLGVFLACTVYAESILTAFLIKAGQMVEVLNNVFITRPHSTNGYFLEQGLVQVSSKWTLLQGTSTPGEYLSTFPKMCIFHSYFLFEIVSFSYQYKGLHVLLMCTTHPKKLSHNPSLHYLHKPGRCQKVLLLLV